MNQTVRVLVMAAISYIAYLAIVRIAWEASINPNHSK